MTAARDRLGWLTDRQRDGGIDAVPLPADVPGALHLCGKHAVGRVSIDPEWTIVCLVERHEIADRYPAYLARLTSRAPGTIWWPIPDLAAPPVDRVIPFVDGLVDRLRGGERLVVHCGAGMGRAGTAAVGILLRLGVDLDTALATVAAARPGAGPEVGPQRDLVTALAARPGGIRGGRSR